MMNTKSADLCADLIVAAVVARYATEHSMKPTDALRYFISTKTYDLLTDPESRLCHDSAEYVLFMLDAEEKGDWERWLKI
ncbi:hypothetical protein LQZ18_02475 [Lachnospiraceae bacterium ZAX-1]